jgi:tetratricopeptide (TPR) repeat protein
VFGGGDAAAGTSLTFTALGLKPFYGQIYNTQPSVEFKMMFDKEKARRSAEKNLSQGKIQAAIKDYCQIVENDTKDYNTLNTLGDLYVRVEAKEEAIACFNRIAEHYNSQGFAHKAIAMYKKILRLQPNSVEVSAKLAPLYQTLGLVAEARSFYITVAESFQKKGDQVKALEIWSRIADLDPNDTNTRLKLAESFLKENEAVKAVEAYSEAGNRLLAQGQVEEAAIIFNKALELQPMDLTALNGATSTSLALGMVDEAVERLEKVYELYPNDSDVLSLLAHAYVEAENAERAEETINKLIEREPVSYKRHLDVVQLYVKQNKPEDAARVLDYCGELLLSNHQEDELLRWVNEILARNPEQLTGLRLLVRVRAWQRNEDELKNALERLAETAQFTGAEEEERSALIELATLFPEDERYITRLRELGSDFEPAPQEVAAFPAQPEAVPTFESFETFGDESRIPAYTNGFAADDTTAWAAVESDIHDPYGANGFATVNDDNIQETSFDFNNGGANEFGAVVIDTTADFSFETDVIITDASGKDAALQAQLEKELESVDFYITQNYRDLALDSLNLLETQYGSHPSIQNRRNQLAGITPAPSPNSFANGNGNGHASAPIVVEPPKTVEEKPVEAVVANSGFEDLFAELGDDLEVADLHVSQTADYETHYNLGLAYKEMGLMDDAVEEFQNAVKMCNPGDGTSRYLQCCNLIGHCFMEKQMPKLAVKWFQKGLDAPGQTEDEYQALRYELGIAYEQSGEEDKALELFAEIYSNNVGYRNVGDKVRMLQAT